MVGGRGDSQSLWEAKSPTLLLEVTLQGSCHVASPEDSLSLAGFEKLHACPPESSWIVVAAFVKLPGDSQAEYVPATFQR